MAPGGDNYSPESILYGYTDTRGRTAAGNAPPGLDCFSTAVAAGYFEGPDWSGCTRWLAKVGEMPMQMLPEGNGWKASSATAIRIQELVDDINRRNSFSQNRIGSRPRSFWENLEQCEVDRNYDRGKGKVSIAASDQPDHPHLFTQNAYLQAVEYLAGGGGEWRVGDRKLYYLLGEGADELVHGCITQLSITG